MTKCPYCGSDILRKYKIKHNSIWHLIIFGLAFGLVISSLNFLPLPNSQINKIQGSMALLLFFPAFAIYCNKFANLLCLNCNRKLKVKYKSIAGYILFMGLIFLGYCSLIIKYTENITELTEFALYFLYAFIYVFIVVFLFAKYFVKLDKVNE